MKTIFLTSSVGGCKKTSAGKVATTWDNSEHFVDRLREVCPKINKFVFVASNPDGYGKSIEYAKLLTDALNNDNFGIEEISIIDHKFVGDIKKTIISADVVFLAGGNVPMQNKYFKEIGLKEILTKFNGVLIGQSAGSMNCAEMVYSQPEEEEEFADKNYQKEFSGLGLTKIRIMPHMNFADKDCFGTTAYKMCLEDSEKIYHYGIYDGGFVEIQNGKAIAHGKVLLFKDKQCYTIANENDTTILPDDYSVEMAKNY